MWGPALAGPQCNAREERREMRQREALGDVVYTPIASIAVEQRGFAKVVERRRRLAGPVDTPQSLQCPAYAQPMANDAEREVIADDVRTGNRNERGGHDQQQPIDAEPDAMAPVVALQGPADQTHHLFERHV